MAQGTVTWAAGYPKCTASNPPAKPQGFIEVLGTYTVDPGWTVVDASFNYQNPAGGAWIAVPLEQKNGQLGSLDAMGNIVPWTGWMTQGQKFLWLVVRYENVATGQTAFIGSAYVTFTF